MNTERRIRADTQPASYFRTEKFLRMYASHLALRMYARKTGYSLYATYDEPGVFAKGDRLASNLRTLRHVDCWIKKYSDFMIAHLGTA